MSRTYSSFVTGVFAVLALSISAGATPIVGAGSSQAHSFHVDGGAVYTSSLGSGGNQGHPGFAAGNSSLGSAGFGPHQFALHVPSPPPPPQTPEPSTLILFGSGLTMVAGVRRKLQR